MPDGEGTTEIEPQPLDRLAAVGIVTDAELKFWRKHWRYNRDGFWWALERNEAEEAKSVAAYRQWSPRLREFAAECRAAPPIPPTADSSRRSGEQHRILSERMREFRDLTSAKLLTHSKPNRAVVVYTSPADLLAAATVFGDTDAPIFTRAEFERFGVEGPHSRRPMHAAWWCDHFWWDLPAREDSQCRSMLGDHEPAPVGSTVWILDIGCMFGPKAGGGHYERWLWDGEQATFWDHSGRWVS